MTPEIASIVNELLALQKELTPNLAENLPPDEVQALAKQFETTAQEKRAELALLFARVQQAPKPRQPRMPRLPNVPARLETIQTLGPSEFTHPYVIEKMLEVAEISETDVLYDLGSGDGRIVEAAADLYRIQAGGVEIAPFYVRLARARAIARGLKSYVDYMEGDAEKIDLANATVVTLFLSAEGNLKLRPKLREELPHGARIVSHRHDMGDWKPDLVTQAKDHNQEWHTIYRWRIHK